jgi:hypothetical protein
MQLKHFVRTGGGWCGGDSDNNTANQHHVAAAPTNQGAAESATSQPVTKEGTENAGTGSEAAAA